MQEKIADALSETIVRFSGERVVGPAYEKTLELGPLVSKSHKAFVEKCIEGVEEGAKLLLDGRAARLRAMRMAFTWVPLFDHVTLK